MSAQVRQQLIDKAREFRREAGRCLEDGALDSAVVLLSKAAFAVVDHHLFVKSGIVPSDHRKRKHAVRFRLPEVLPYLGDVYDKYISAYQQRMTETDAEVVTDALEKILELTETSL